MSNQLFFQIRRLRDKTTRKVRKEVKPSMIT